MAHPIHYVAWPQAGALVLHFAVILVLYNMESTFRVDFALFARSKIKEFSWSSQWGRLEITNNE